MTDADTLTTPSETMTDDAPDSPAPNSIMGGDESTPVREFDRKMAAPRTHDSRLRVLTEHVRALTEQEIREGLEGNLCRCTGYQAIVDAVCEVLAARRQGVSV